LSTVYEFKHHWGIENSPFGSGYALPFDPIEHAFSNVGFILYYASAVSLVVFQVVFLVLKLKSKR